MSRWIDVDLPAPLAQALQAVAARAGQENRQPDPGLAMEVATAILYVDAVLEDGELDVAEISTGSLAMRADQGLRGYVGVPAFVLVQFGQALQRQGLAHMTADGPVPARAFAQVFACRRQVAGQPLGLAAQRLDAGRHGRRRLPAAPGRTAARTRCRRAVNSKRPRRARPRG